MTPLQTGNQHTEIILAVCAYGSYIFTGIDSTCTQNAVVDSFPASQYCDKPGPPARLVAC